MSNQDPKPDGDANGSPSDKNAKGSPASASLTDPREPWRLAVAAAEASADAQLRYAGEVATLRKELKAAVVPDDMMRKLRDRVVEVEQILRNQSAEQPPVEVEPSTPPIIAWLLLLIVLWLAAVSGVLAGRIGAENDAARHPVESSKGGFHP